MGCEYQIGKGELSLQEFKSLQFKSLNRTSTDVLFFLKNELHVLKNDVSLQHQNHKFENFPVVCF